MKSSPTFTSILAIGRLPCHVTVTSNSCRVFGWVDITVTPTPWTRSLNYRVRSDHCYNRKEGEPFEIFKEHKKVFNKAYRKKLGKVKDLCIIVHLNNRGELHLLLVFQAAQFCYQPIIWMKLISWETESPLFHKESFSAVDHHCSSRDIMEMATTWPSLKRPRKRGPTLLTLWRMFIWDPRFQILLLHWEALLMKVKN